MIPPLFEQRFHTLSGQDTSSCLYSVAKSIRVNTLKISVEAFKKIAQKNGWELSPIPWEKTGFFIERENKETPLGKSIEYFLGLFYIQEASSMLPASVLSPTKQDFVLDMAAAPGSKTTQLSCMMENQNIILSNDSSASRIKALATNIERQGCINVGLSTLNGKTLGDILPDTFNKILLDAPCSGEGTAHKDPSYFKRWSIHTIKQFAGLQKSLLSSAFKALRAEGILVYSTCTFAPEENEGVVDFLLQHYKGHVTLLSIDRYENLLTPGITTWEEAHFDSSVTNTMRVFPAKTKAGGFFVAKMQKTDTVSYTKTPTPFLTTEEILREKEKKQYTVFLLKTYGIEEDFFDPYIMTKIGQGIWLKPKRYMILSRYIRTDRFGVHLFVINKDGSLKISTTGAFAIGTHATHNTIVLDQDQMKTYIQGKDVRLTDNQLRHITNEYVILKEERGFVLGTGLLQKPGNIKNQLPRYFVQGR